MNIDWDKVFTYLEGSLSDKDKIIFEKEISQNIELQEVINDFKANDILLKNLTKHTRSSNFVVNVNKKIDEYELNQVKWYIQILDKLSDFRIASVAATFSLIFVFSFVTYKISSPENINLTNGSEEYNNNLIAVNDDSLNSLPDSLKYQPTLLIGNDY